MRAVPAPTRAPRPATAPRGVSSTGRRTYVPLPGRQPGRAATGRAPSRALPSRAGIAASKPSAGTGSSRGLERRVDALSKEVRAMRATLERLARQLSKEQKQRLIR